MTTTQLFISIIIISLVTIALRFFPFLIFNGKKSPAWLSYLGTVLPYAIMGMIVIYCIKDISFSTVSAWLPTAVAGAAAVFSYIWKRNTLFSIIISTAIYMILIRIM